MKQGEMELGVKFRPPNLDKVIVEAVKMGLPTIEAERFHSYFESNGWMVGRVKMKSWTAALNNWRLRLVQGQSKSDALRKRTVYELKTIIEAKQRVCDELASRHRTQKPGAFGGYRWNCELSRQRYADIKREIAELTNQLASM